MWGLCPTPVAGMCDIVRYSKPLIWAHLGHSTTYQGLRDTPLVVIKKQRCSWENLRTPTKEFSSPGRTVALQSYHRPSDHADAGIGPPRERGARRTVE